MKKATVTISALCYALNQAFNSNINIFSDLCNEDETDYLETAKTLASEILFQMEEAGMTTADAQRDILWYDDSLMIRVMTADTYADLHK